MGPPSFSPPPTTTPPRIETLPMSWRIASTAAPSPPFLSPRPTQRPAAIAAASVTRTSSMARLRSGASRRRSGLGPVIGPPWLGCTARIAEVGGAADPGPVTRGGGGGSVSDPRRTGGRTGCRATDAMHTPGSGGGPWTGERRPVPRPPGPAAGSAAAGQAAARIAARAGHADGPRGAAGDRRGRRRRAVLLLRTRRPDHRPERRFHGRRA